MTVIRSFADSFRVSRHARGIEPPMRRVRVLDLTRVLAGPTATMLLADRGRRYKGRGGKVR
jgi:hypothetical protein